ncbi:MAG: AAA family ATPase [Synergistaceae bacterium]|nr:AAA family ATPase [Synergistaceae bacterium]
MRRETKELIESYFDSLCPVLYIHHSDFAAVDDVIRNSPAANAAFREFNNALGSVDFTTKNQQHPYSLTDFLKATADDAFNGEEVIILLKDIHDSIDSPDVIAMIRRIAEDALTVEDYNAKIIIVDSKVNIPFELESFITLIDVPLPDDEEIRDCVETFAEAVSVTLSDKEKDELIFSLKGLSSFQINQVLSIAYQKGGSIGEADKKFILEEKEQMIKKSGILEMVNFDESIEDIGGLENLKKWLERKAKIFSRLDEARKQKVDIPGGVLILGMPGCGKSLTAKATARLFNAPLIRLDVGRLMGKYVGESEDNMRRALRLAEAVSPCVLWVDELEKAFAGIGGDSSGVTTRLFGQFLTWMQEKKSSVFVAATANDISKLPPEFLRKGRFDELFFVDLPNQSERKKILEIHLQKRGKFSPSIDLDKLSSETQGYNGADLEGIVREASETAFIEGMSGITTELLLSIRKETKSISDIQRDKIEGMRTSLKKYSIKPASA